MRNSRYMPLGDRVIRAALRLALVLCALSLAVVIAHADPAWTFRADDDILFERLTPLGTLMVSTETGLVGLDPATGKVRWKRRDIKKLKECDYDVLAGVPYGLIDFGDDAGPRPPRIEALDLASGETRWDSEDLPIKSSFGQLPGPNDLLIMAGVPKLKNSKVTFVRLNAATGAMQWENPELFSKDLVLRETRGSDKLCKRFSIEGSQPLVLDSDNTTLMYLTEDGPIKVDITTGHKIWTADKLKGKEPPAVCDGYAPMLVGRGKLFVPSEKTVVAVDLENGHIVWSTRELKSRVAQMTLTAQGLVIRGESRTDDKGRADGKPFVDCLDPTTGRSLWREPPQVVGSATQFQIKDDRMYIAIDGDLLSVGLEDGAARSVAKFRFKGDEAATTLELRGDDFVLGSNQNVMRLSPTGATQYQAFYQAPGQTGWIKILTAAASLASGAASYGYSNALVPGASYRRLWVAPNQELSRRLEAARTGDDCVLFETTVDTEGRVGPGAVKIDKETGRELARCHLGDRPRDCELDAIDGRVFLRRGRNEIACYKF